MPTLKAIAGACAGQRFDWSSRELTIGREVGCQVVLPSRTVSRQHARIIREADGYYLEDLRSVNGTSVNGRPVDRRTRLAEGDEVQVYDNVLIFFEQPPSDVEPVDSGAVPLSETDPPDSNDTPLSESAPPEEGSQQIKVRDFQLQNHTNDSAVATLQAVLKITRSIGSSFNLHEILPNTLDNLFEIFPQVQRGYVLQVAGPSGELTPTVIKHAADESDTISPISSAVAQRVMQEGTAFLSDDLASDERLEELSESIFDEPVRSIMCAPLMGPTATAMGVIQLESNDARRPFTRDDLELLVSVALLAGQAVESAQMHQSLLELDRRHREAVLAKDVQLQFLPAKFPQIASYKFYHYYQAADYVAGDYFDYIPLPDGRLAIVQGDVSGKGISAALFVARLCAEVRYALLTTETASEAITRLNYALCHQTHGDSFITFLLFILDPQTHRLIGVNAGHPPPLLRRAATGEVEALVDEGGGLPLGVDGDAVYSESLVVELQPGDVLLEYTDGVSELPDADDSMYGEASIRRSMRGSGSQPLHVVRSLLADLRTFGQGRVQCDDICIVCFSRVT